ncbi:MAG: alpha/beta hydrolase [Chloroflexaceae bacterium]|nr:alpha/beta hydrolase [Chloroflexaceae bacterium]
MTQRSNKPVSPLVPGTPTIPPGQLVTVNQLQVHTTLAGQGAPAMVLLHGSFLSAFSWREVLAPLATHRTVLAFDRIAFGQTARPAVRHPWGHRAPDNPYRPEAQADLTVALMDRFGLDTAVLVGSSTGGTVALLTALRHPSRVRALVLVGAMVYSGYPVSEIPLWVLPLLPNRLMSRVVGLVFRRAYASLLRSFWYDRAKMTPDVLATYQSLLQVDHWSQGIWELIRATHRLGLDERLGTISVPSLVLTGEHDRTVPIEQSVRLARELPNAHLVIIPECGHLPHEEQPERFVHEVGTFLARLSQNAPQRC